MNILGRCLDCFSYAELQTLRLSDHCIVLVLVMNALNQTRN